MNLIFLFFFLFSLIIMICFREREKVKRKYFILCSSLLLYYNTNISFISFSLRLPIISLFSSQITIPIYSLCFEEYYKSTHTLLLHTITKHANKQYLIIPQIQTYFPIQKSHPAVPQAILVFSLNAATLL